MVTGGVPTKSFGWTKRALRAQKVITNLDRRGVDKAFDWDLKALWAKKKLQILADEPWGANNSLMLLVFLVDPNNS